jgi:selenocysteine-specific translation elongation factor
MKNLTVGIFHDEEIGRELGKRGTESDIVMYNRKTDDCIFTFMQPVGDKVSVKSQIMSSIDAAILSFTEMTPAVGETVLMLDSFGISRGIIIVPPYTDPSKITSLTKGTSLESFIVTERDILKIQEILDGFESTRDTDSPVSVEVDHSFHVKGVGEIILGSVRIGIVKRHDKLLLLPDNKEVVVRSIQMQDKDVNEAAAGSRVGLAIKGATAEEMNRGSVICAPDSAKTATTITLSFTPNRYYAAGIREGTFHLAVGMQTIPVNVTGINNGTITIESKKPIVYTSEGTFLLLDLNAKKLHVMGKGHAIESS